MQANNPVAGAHAAGGEAATGRIPTSPAPSPQQPRLPAKGPLTNASEEKSSTSVCFWRWLLAFAGADRVSVALALVLLGLMLVSSRPRHDGSLPAVARVTLQIGKYRCPTDHLQYSEISRLLAVFAPQGYFREFALLKDPHITVRFPRRLSSDI